MRFDAAARIKAKSGMHLTSKHLVRWMREEEEAGEQGMRRGWRCVLRQHQVPLTNSHSLSLHSPLSVSLPWFFFSVSPKSPSLPYFAMHTLWISFHAVEYEQHTVLNAATISPIASLSVHTLEVWWGTKVDKYVSLARKQVVTQKTSTRSTKTCLNVRLLVEYFLNKMRVCVRARKQEKFDHRAQNWEKSRIWSNVLRTNSSILRWCFTSLCCNFMSKQKQNDRTLLKHHKVFSYNRTL